MPPALTLLRPAVDYPSQDPTQVGATASHGIASDRIMCVCVCVSLFLSSE
jgi:hypothetical protein